MVFHTVLNKAFVSCSLFYIYSVEMVTEVIYWYSSCWPLALTSVYFAQVESLTKNVQFSPNIKPCEIFFPQKQKRQIVLGGKLQLSSPILSLLFKWNIFSGSNCVLWLNTTDNFLKQRVVHNRVMLFSQRLATQCQPFPWSFFLWTGK